MVLERQQRVAVNLPAVRSYVRRLRGNLRLGRRDFNVCFVDDREIKRLNSWYRGKRQATDVLSFPWEGSGGGLCSPAAAQRAPRPKERRRVSVVNGDPNGEFRDFLGDVVISAETARRNARTEGHSTEREIRWLILHGLLHLLGYDHAADNGEMTAREHYLRARLGIQG